MPLTRSIYISILGFLALANTCAFAAEQMRVGFVNQCPVTASVRESGLEGIAAGVLIAVGTRLVGDTVDAISGYLTKTDAKTYTATARINAFGDRAIDGTTSINAQEACIVVVIGKTFNNAMTAEQRAALRFSASDRKIVDATPGISSATGLTDGLIFYFEGILQPAKSGEAFTLIPKYWYLPGFLGQGGLQYKPERDLLFKIELAAPGKPAFAAWEMQWTAMAAGKVSNDEVVNRTLVWAAMPQELANRTKPGTFFPINANVILTETAQPYTILKYIGEALAGQKQAIVSEAQTALQSALLQQARLDARKAALTSIEAKFKAYNDAYATAKDAQSKYAAATDPATKTAALVAARVAYSRFDVATAELRAVYDGGDLGPFPTLPALPPLPA